MTPNYYHINRDIEAGKEPRKLVESARSRSGRASWQRQNARKKAAHVGRVGTPEKEARLVQGREPQNAGKDSAPRKERLTPSAKQASLSAQESRRGSCCTPNVSEQKSAAALLQKAQVELNCEQEGLEKHAVSQVTSLLVSEARLRRRRSRHEKAPPRSSGCDSKGLEKSMPPAGCQLVR